MAKAKIVKQLIVVTPNEVGTLNKISTALSAAGLNISHLCASALTEEARFMIVVADPAKAKRILEGMEYEVVESDALEVEFENAPGTLSPVAKRLGDADIDIKYIYGTTADGSKIIGIISTNDDKKAVALINS
ncbi:MAG: hypothetical protein JW946_02630 [Candidatus Omnitrophica bacterium]|nr:hypothetical protein [Candidatus Omnitrophota bacterium]